MHNLAVDVGGTFTDTIAIDETSGNIHLMKTRSTPRAPEEGFVSSVTRLLDSKRLKASDVRNIVHVSTIGTNLFLGQLGIDVPKVGLVTTKGFRDVIEIGRQNRAELYNLAFQRPKPLVQRKCRFEVYERVDAEGNVQGEIEQDELRKVNSKLDAEGIESVAICFINSYLNPENERKAKGSLSTSHGRLIFTSSEVDPEHREYERTSTTVVNAALAPVVSKYLNNALIRLRSVGVDAPLQILSSSGGIVDVEEAKLRPIVAIESGPAAGVVGAAEIARQLQISRLISLDMGGTSAKAGSVVDYTPLVVPEIEVGGRVHMGRLVKGSGYPVRYPCIDLAEVSAGGGTIIWVDEVGSLKVGPISAGSEPGPAAYGLGGKNPTITDANLLLGRIGQSLLGGELPLNKELAQEAFGKAAEQAGMDLYEAAAASLTLVNLQMAKAIDIVSLERGYDPREFALLAFGGAGPMHAAELAEQVGILTVIVPPVPGLFSALSMLMTDMKYTFVRGIVRMLEEVSEESLEASFKEIAEQAVSQLKERGAKLSNVSVKRSVDLRYLGQGYELEIEGPTPLRKKEFADEFEKKHEMIFGYRHAGDKVEITALRLTVTIPVKKSNLNLLAQGSPSGHNNLKEHRPVWFNGEWTETPVYWRNDVSKNAVIQGPAIIEGYDSTIVVPSTWSCSSSHSGCMVLRR